MRIRTAKTTAVPPTTSTGGERSGEGEWEMRPGGMLVQKRTDSDQNRPPPPTIMVRVKFGSIYHEVHISSQATFGELKKMLSGPTGLHHEDQKLLFKDKERDSNAFLDAVGVKAKSKIVLMEDPLSQERRYIELKRNAKMEKAAKSISEISLDIDRLAGQVSALESVISKGGRIEEKNLTNATELLMNQLLKLDAIVVDGDAKLQRKLQVKRVQKYVETLDALKIKNSLPHSSNGDTSRIQQSSSVQQARHSSAAPVPLQPARHSPSSSVVITTRWETFDAIPTSTASQSSHSSRPSVDAVATGSPQPRFNWDLL